jgi:hypothetical protein
MSSQANYRYADPRMYAKYEQRLAAARERRDVVRLYCRGCRFETNHAHGTRYAYCLTCLRNHP